jgi:hypothetical protein
MSSNNQEAILKLTNAVAALYFAVRMIENSRKSPEHYASEEVNQDINKQLEQAFAEISATLSALRESYKQ